MTCTHDLLVYDITDDLWRCRRSQDDACDFWLPHEVSRDLEVKLPTGYRNRGDGSLERWEKEILC